MNYYPKTIKKDPLHNWKEVEKYRDNNKGRLPTEPTIKERDIRLLIDELGFEWHSVRTWIFERAYGVEKIRFTISQSRTQKDHWMFTIKSKGYIQQTRTNKLEEIWNEIHAHF